MPFARLQFELHQRGWWQAVVVTLYKIVKPMRNPSCPAGPASRMLASTLQGSNLPPCMSRTCPMAVCQTARYATLDPRVGKRVIAVPLNLCPERRRRITMSDGRGVTLQRRVPEEALRREYRPAAPAHPARARANTGKPPLTVSISCVAAVEYAISGEVPGTPEAEESFLKTARTSDKHPTSDKTRGVGVWKGWPSREFL